MYADVQIAICAHSTVLLHRNQAHRALALHPAASHFFRFWLWLTTGMATKEWVSIHRKHHAKVDAAEDPHSPQVCGIWNMELYDHRMPDDWLERNMYAKHGVLGIGIMMAIDLVLFGPIGLTMWAVQMLWIPFFAAGVINGIGHHRGYRNFAPYDASRNILPWGLFIGGEELHNNHHA
jgi:stearoyl-CoA desaturase (delta-9 desaturase)